MQREFDQHISEIESPVFAAQLFPPIDYLTFTDVSDKLEKLDYHAEFIGSTELQLLDQNNMQHLITVVWKPRDKNKPEQQFCGTLKSFNLISVAGVSLATMRKALTLPSPFKKSFG